MVAGADYNYAAFAGLLNLFCAVLSSSAFYLYLILEKGGRGEKDVIFIFHSDNI